MKRSHGMIASCGVIAGVVAAAHAGSVFVQAQGNEIGRGVVVSLSGGLTFADGAASRTVWAGQKSLLVDGQFVRAFSAELTSTNADGWFEQSSAQDALGAVKAQAISSLFGARGDHFNDRNEAATFQAMLWEIIYDFDGSEQSLDMHSGNIAFGMLNGALFDSMRNAAIRGGSTPSIAIIASDASNDHMRIVPLPSAAGLAGLGLLGLAAKRRRA
ncbi:MAG: hypothetical protein IPJ41_15085 [Phycisphaerales bacterium]|nr:hypothetical protein [Phycisphaerales bacterium]